MITNQVELLEKLGFQKVKTIKTKNIFEEDDHQINFKYKDVLFTTFSSDLSLLLKNNNEPTKGQIIAICK